MTSGKWSMKGWSTGQPVSFFDALGISKKKTATIHYPQFQATMPAQVAQSQQQAQTGGGASGGGSGTPTGGSDAQNAALGQQMAAASPYNWTGVQWTDLNNIAMAESGWSTTATNPSSGAYGIPQALPGSKMASSGSDWKTDPRTQIAWMLEYIRSRYGTPANAWAFHLANGWY